MRRLTNCVPPLESTAVDGQGVQYWICCIEALGDSAELQGASVAIAKGAE